MWPPSRKTVEKLVSGERGQENEGEDIQYKPLLPRLCIVNACQAVWECSAFVPWFIVPATEPEKRVHTRPLCGAQVSDKVRLRPGFNRALLYILKKGCSSCEVTVTMSFCGTYIFSSPLEKCLLLQNLLQMSANDLLLAFMLLLILQSFVSVLSSLISLY